MKISILYDFKETAWGGANQFAKSLRSYFQSIDAYSENPNHADVVLFFSYPFGSEHLYRTVFNLKRKHRICVINRMYGPIAMYRKNDGMIDKINFRFNENVSDGTVFQSRWSRAECYRAGLPKTLRETVICNSPDPSIFFPSKERVVSRNEKIRLLSGSWSPNPLKGFDVYYYLDEHLDTKRFEMRFVGQCPAPFKRIRHIPPCSSHALAEELRNCDILVLASHIETCSNMLLEALHCGVPVVARNNSSQPELVNGGGVLFEGTDDILKKIAVVTDDIKEFRRGISVSSLQEVGNDYYKFCQSVLDSCEGTPAKFWTRSSYVRQMTWVTWWKVLRKVRAGIRRGLR